jgi:multisubunit Na+/H+ antiporter MnhC subunit
MALLIAVGTYFVIRRQSVRAVLAVGLGSLFVLGWIVWCYANKTNAEAVNVAYYTTRTTA